MQGLDPLIRRLESLVERAERLLPPPAPPENLLIYATSNRRHLMPERFAENRETVRGDDGKIHPGETRSRSRNASG